MDSNKNPDTSAEETKSPSQKEQESAESSPTLETSTGSDSIEPKADTAVRSAKINRKLSDNPDEVSEAKKLKSTEYASEKNFEENPAKSSDQDSGKKIESVDSTSLKPEKATISSSSPSEMDITQPSSSKSQSSIPLPPFETLLKRVYERLLEGYMDSFSSSNIETINEPLVSRPVSERNPDDQVETSSSSSDQNVRRDDINADPLPSDNDESSAEDAS